MSKKDDKNKDKFGKVKPVDGSEFVRDSEKITARDGHMGLRKKLQAVQKRNKKAAQKAKMMELLDTADSGFVAETVGVASQSRVLEFYA